MGLREFGAMFLDVTYWRTGSVDQGAPPRHQGSRRSADRKQSRNTA